MKFHIIAAAAIAVSTIACEAEPADEAPATGTLRSMLVAPELRHDVAAVRFDVHNIGANPDVTCDDAPMASRTSPLEDEALPMWLAGDDSMHAFADGLFVLQPGQYLVCATPLRDDGTPSEECHPGADVFEVVAEETAEGVIYLQCDGDPSGGLDVIAALNDPPHIDDLEIAPSKFIDVCEDAVINVTASDPNGDPLAYAWAIVDGPAGHNAAIVGAGAQASFETDMAGNYQIEVVVSDGHGGEARLTFPIHVSDADCVVEGVQHDVPEDDVLARGWSACWSSAYNDPGHPMVDVLDTCDGEYLMMACRRFGEPNLLLAAEGEAAEVVMDVGPGAAASHTHNGVEWYFSPDRSWGFAPGGSAVNRNSCDVEMPREPRMCWHMNSPGAAPGEIAGGWNCGVDTFLQNADGAQWERILYTR